MKPSRATTGRRPTSVPTAPDGRITALHAPVTEAVHTGDTHPLRALFDPHDRTEGAPA